MKTIAYVGIDYHINVLAIAVVVKDKKDLYETIRISNNDKPIKRYMKKLSNKFTIKACYEASSSGYAFQRKMASWGYDCVVIAPLAVINPLSAPLIPTRMLDWPPCQEWSRRAIGAQPIRSTPR